MSSNKLFVASLSFKMRDDDLRAVFTPVGNVMSAKVIMSRDGRSKGYGFVEMETAEEAANAIMQLNGTEHFGRPIVVAEQKPQTTSSRPPMADAGAQQTTTLSADSEQPAQGATSQEGSPMIQTAERTEATGEQSSLEA